MNLTDRVGQIISRHQLGAVENIIAANEFPTIGSDGIFKASTVSGQFTIKFMKNRDKLAQRAQYHQALSRFAPLSKLLIVGEDYMIFEYMEGVSLLHLILNDGEKAFGYYEQALEQLSELWQKTHNLKQQRRNSSELERGEALIMEYLGGAENLALIINGQNYGLSFRRVFDAILDYMKKAQTTCLGHGDAHLDNVIVNSSNNGITLIDLRPGFCWLDDLVVFTWQKSFQFIQFQESPAIKASSGALEIDYQVKSSVFIEKAEQLALTTALNFARDNGSANWQKRYYYTQAAAALCEIAGVQRRRQINALKWDIPETAEYFWVAEAVINFQLAQQYS